MTSPSALSVIDFFILGDGNFSLHQLSICLRIILVNLHFVTFDDPSQMSDSTVSHSMKSVQVCINLLIHPGTNYIFCNVSLLLWQDNSVIHHLHCSFDPHEFISAIKHWNSWHQSTPPNSKHSLSNYLQHHKAFKINTLFDFNISRDSSNTIAHLFLRLLLTC